jgi:histidinol phosphatase-like enzyme
MANKMTSKVIEEKMEPIDNLVFKSFVKRFNEKYEENLLSEQKEMFSKYILSFSNNGVEFNSFLNEEIGRLKEKINESLKTEEVSEDDEMTQKTKEIYELLESYKTRKPDENMILEIAKIQELAREFSSNGS